jgi:hypothetical protein
MRNEINIVKTSGSWMYISKSKALGYELAEDWMFFWTFFMPIALIMNMVSKGNLLVYKGLGYIIIIFTMTIIRRYIASSYKYLLANLFLVFLAFIISFTLIEKLLFGIPIIFCFMNSTKKRRKEIISFCRISTLLWMEMLMLIYYFVAFGLKLAFMMSLISFASINVAITCVLYLYVSSFSKLMEWEGQFIKDYIKRMKKIKLSCIAFISGTIVFFLLFAWRTGLYELFDMLTNKLFNLFITMDSNEVKPIKIKPFTNKVIPNLGKRPMNFITGKKNYLITAILNIIKFILLAAISIALIYLLFKLFIKAWDFYKSLRLKKTYKREEREFVFSLDDIKKEIKDKAEKFKASLELPFNMSNRKKIRKLYYKLIELYKTKGLLAFDFNTPIEIESKIREVLDKNINEATLIYEKARYSQRECSKEDVDRMKTFFKNI